MQRVPAGSRRLPEKGDWGHGQRPTACRSHPAHRLCGTERPCRDARDRADRGGVADETAQQANDATADAGTGAGTGAGADGSADGNDIVVTARLSSERLQDVPIVVTTLSRQDLERQGIDDLSDVAERTVGFALETFTGILVQPVIRGQTNLRTTSPVQNVSTNINGVYLQRGYFVDQALLDLERVEIIKGPQSALYGRNAFAGVISLITRQP
jgi:outer membrane receptor protein involved in Fe transport